jgi:hypothetical protein
MVSYMGWGEGREIVCAISTLNALYLLKMAAMVWHHHPDSKLNVHVASWMHPHPSQMRRKTDKDLG